MSEIAEMYADLAEISRQKRASNRKDSANLLDSRGIEYEAKNMGAHLIVKANKSVIDFWPGTGLWIERNSTSRSRGVMRLIKHVNKRMGQA